MALIDTYELADRYRADSGRVFVSGSQALARLPVAQLRADRRRGWNTAAYVTGYPGSPLANYDRDAAAAALQAGRDGLTMIAQPAVNEELAAGAVMGAQLVSTIASRRVDGVIGVWYGKGPGLDRAGDAIRHAMFAGTSPRGGAVALVGDDPGAKSSTIPSASDAALRDLQLPVLLPGDVQEAVDLGRHAVALSRASGLWAAIIVVDSVADGTGTVDLLDERFEPVIPVIEIDGRVWAPQPTGRLLTPDTLDLERQLHTVKAEMARQYGVANGLNAVRVRSAADWLGIVAGGHTYRETRAALAVLGLGSDDELRAAGLRLFQVGLLSPLDPAQLREFAGGLAEVIVVEEKQPTLEGTVRDALYPLADRPLIHGKSGPDGSPLFARYGTLPADTIAAALRPRLASRLAPERLAPLPPARPAMIPLTVERTPYFCSGCPHNTSTAVPPGTLVGAGIGCHTMTLFMEPERVGTIIGVGAMGSEGAPWIGMAPFVGEEHLVQNLGDGTLAHSGWLAIRAAVAAKVNITYKILFNGAVAMTGGQDAVGAMDVPHLASALVAEGASRVLITTDEPHRYRQVDLPAGVAVWGRSRLLEAQTVLAGVPGCTVLIHDQRCAAEKRRDRKRGAAERPRFRVVINERVCEGCGDCADRSNCLSVQPVQTPYGRKTAIDQHSCNHDLTCMEGDCPAFATVTVAAGGPPRQAVAQPPSHLPTPPVADADQVTIRLSGIGGTGVVTVSQVLGTAAMLDGLTVRGLDQTGLSQKAGPVVSDLVVSRQDPSPSNRASAGSVDVLVAFDQLVAGSDRQIGAANARRTVLVANRAETPTGSMVTNPALAYPATVTERLTAATRAQHFVDAGRLVRGLLGDDTMVNVFLTGVAAQLGLLPMTTAAIERAIALNGVAVETNLAALRWGRAYAVDPDGATQAAGVTVADRQPETTTQLIDRLAADLIGFQSARTAARFRRTLAPVIALGHDPLTASVARSLHQLTAYKDEYEVARLLLLPEAREAVRRVGGRRTRVTWRLRPPLLHALGMRRKMRFGRWARPALVVLRSARRLRGTPFDPFGYAAIRRTERALAREYRDAVTTILGALGPNPPAARLDEAVAIAGLAEQVRGYERLKEQRAAAYRSELARRLAAFSAATAAGPQASPTAASE